MKITYLSYLRVFAMLMVVLYHCLLYYTPIWNYDSAIMIEPYFAMARFLNYIDMPLFIMISGFLYGHLLAKGRYGDWKEFVKKKIQRIGVPFIFWSFIVCIFLSSKPYLRFVIEGASHLWFLGMLLLLFLGFHATKKYWETCCKKKDILILSALTVASIITLKIPQNPGFILYQTICYAYIFYIGILFSKYHQRIALGGVKYWSAY